MLQEHAKHTDTSDGQDEAESPKAGRKDTAEPHRVSPWEWAVAALGLALVVGVIGFMLYRAYTEAGTPPTIEFTIDAIQPSGPGYLVTFTATNRGDEAAAAVMVEGHLIGDDGSVETSAVTLTSLPGGSQRQGGLYFGTDPRARQLTLRAMGY